MNDRDAAVILKAQARIMRLKRGSTWREVVDVLSVRSGVRGLNVGTVFKFVVNNKVPVDRSLRQAVGLPRVLPSERKQRVKRTIPRVGEAGWEEFYLKKVKG